MNRAAQILGFEAQEVGLKNLLDPTKTSEPEQELCSQPTKVLNPNINLKPKKVS